MGVGGQRPKPAILKLVEGNPGHRPISTQEPTVADAPAKPKWLKGRGATLWDEVLGFVYWLTIADSYKLAAWCDRQADFEKNRKTWTAADRREHRSLGSELGLDPSSRARMGNDLRGATGGQKTNPKDAASKYFRASS